MKKYLVWKAGGAPTAGVVVKAESSLEARRSVAQRRNTDSIANGRGLIFHPTDFCARLVPDADDIAPSSGSRLTQADADRLELLARRFAQVAEEKSWAGSYSPERAAQIHADYKEQSRALAAAFRELVR